MALPRRLVLRCPTCEEYLEADVHSLQVTSAHDEVDGAGIGVEIAAFVKHECLPLKTKTEAASVAAEPEGETDA